LTASPAFAHLHRGTVLALFSDVSFVLSMPAAVEHHVDLLGHMLGAPARTPVRVRFAGVNAFLGAYLSRALWMVQAPRYTFVGDMIDLDVHIDGYRPLLLFAQVTALWLGHVQVRIVRGPSTDHLVRPLAVRALGDRHASGLFRAPGR
jgi:hypothetical protein